LECQEPWSLLEGTKETAEFILDATTNLESGEKCRHEVRGELLDCVLDCFVLNFVANQFLFRFLETLESLGTNIVRMAPGVAMPTSGQWSSPRGGMTWDLREE